MIGHKLAQILDSDFDLVGLSRKNNIQTIRT